MDLDVWYNGTGDLDFEDIDWDALEEEFEDVDWDAIDEELEGLDIMFEINTDDEVEFLHIEIEVKDKIPEGTDTSTLKLYYFDEDTEIWLFFGCRYHSGSAPTERLPNRTEVLEQA